MSLKTYSIERFITSITSITCEARESSRVVHLEVVATHQPCPWTCAGGTDAGQGQGGGAQVEVTDGWYGVRAQLDAPLSALLASGRLRVGAPQL